MTTTSDWHCLKCSELIPAQFDVCWNCGADRAGVPAETFMPAVEPLGFAAQCRHCGYFLYGRPKPICPECGEPFDPSQNDAPRGLHIHPRVFQLLERWMSETGEPFFTEINLNAIARRRQQFNWAQVQRNGQWMQCPSVDGKSMLRYRIVKRSSKGRYTIEYQDDARGSCVSAVIQFCIKSRMIKKGGVTVAMPVLRILGVT